MGAALLRSAVATLIGGRPKDVRIDRRCDRCGRPHGRPRAPGTGLFLSVSHSRDRIAVAVTTVADVGVDVEWVDRRWPLLADLSEFGGLILAADEFVHNPAEFFTYWTRKEAAVKATGDGMQVPLSEVLVTRPNEPPALRSYLDRPGLQMQLMDLVAVRDYAAAVAILTDVMPEVRQRSAAELDTPGLR